jgi:hypothetical protein
MKEKKKKKKLVPPLPFNYKRFKKNENRGTPLPPE